MNYSTKNTSQKSDYNFYLLLELLQKDTVGREFDDDSFRTFTLLYTDYLSYQSQVKPIKEFLDPGVSKDYKKYFMKELFPKLMYHEGFFDNYIKYSKYGAIAIIAAFIALSGFVSIFGVISMILFVVIITTMIIVRKVKTDAAAKEAVTSLLAVLENQIGVYDESIDLIIESAIHFQQFNNERINATFIRKNFSEMFEPEVFRYVQKIYLLDPKKSLIEALQMYKLEMFKREQIQQSYNHEQEIQRQQEAKAIDAELAERDREFMMYLAAYEEERDQQRSHWK